jgi:aminomethyltransferase
MQPASWIDLSDRGKIRVTGEDRARLLHAMTTNHIQQLKPGEGCYAYFLNAQGRILSDVNLLCRPDSFVVDTEPETREKVLQHLDKYIIADDVQLEDETARTATIALDGRESADVLSRLGAPIPAEPYANQEWESNLIARISYTGGVGFFIMAPVDVKDALIRRVEGCGAAAGTLEQVRIARIENGKPRYGEDLSERFLSQEANQAHALNFSKGCYLGQEIVERVRSRGQVHRLLMPLEIEGTQVPEPGTKIQEEGASVAEITSAAFSPDRNKVVALGYVRIDKAKPGTQMKLGDIPVHVRTAICYDR